MDVPGVQDPKASCVEQEPLGVLKCYRKKYVPENRAMPAGTWCFFVPENSQSHGNESER
jgi:hypothetical protein